jgi:hypothetical protein
VFSPSTFRGAPHTDIATLTYPGGGTAQESAQQEIALLKAVADAFPTVTTVRVREALDAVGGIVTNLVTAIRGASALTLIVAVLVLGGALAAGHRHRVYDAVILISPKRGTDQALRRALTSKASADVKVPGGTPPLVVQGVIAFVDNQVDRTTGTIGAKVTAQNADEVLWPGQSVQVALTVEVKPKMLSVPATAVLPAQQGMIIWVVGADNKVSPRVVTVERIVAQTAFLSSGVALGDRVVTDGQIRLAPGATVRIEQPRRNPTLPASEERRMNGRG